MGEREPAQFEFDGESKEGETEKTAETEGADFEALLKELNQEAAKIELTPEEQRLSEETSREMVQAIGIMEKRAVAPPGRMKKFVLAGITAMTLFVGGAQAVEAGSASRARSGVVYVNAERNANAYDYYRSANQGAYETQRKIYEAGEAMRHTREIGESVRRIPAETEGGDVRRVLWQFDNIARRIQYLGQLGGRR